MNININISEYQYEYQYEYVSRLALGVSEIDNSLTLQIEILVIDN